MEACRLRELLAEIGLGDDEDDEVITFVAETIKSSSGSDDDELAEAIQTYLPSLANQDVQLLLPLISRFRTLSSIALVPKPKPVAVVRKTVKSPNEEETTKESSPEPKLPPNQVQFLSSLGEICGVKPETHQDMLMFLCTHLVLSEDVEECARWIADHGVDLLRLKFEKFQFDQRSKAEEEKRGEEQFRARVLGRFDEIEDDSIRARNRQTRKDALQPESTIR